ncbi:TetR family transcriptional regulator [Actinosynnema sp. NPDC020468]|uniref:TetR family transcriptional regulator n=1 Tax=Actinosynnema sp. NPDC020468 TaxID=3154488 RepID=UPI0033FA2601
MTELTRSLLDAAAGLVASHGARGLRMADVATRAGVSRQTVYNEFGNKDRLVQAVTLHKAAEFADGMRVRLAAEADPARGLREAFEYVFALADSDPMARAVLTGANSGDMLPMVTTQGLPVLLLVTDVLQEHLAPRLPDLPEARVRLVAETTTRIALSHLLTPCGDGLAAVVAVAVALLA